MADSQDESQFEAGYTEQTETPAPKPEVVEVKPEPEVKAEEPADPLKDVIARLDKFEASHNKLAGHIGGLQQSHKEMQERLAAAQAATKTVSDAPTQAQVKDAITDPEEWATLKTEYPEWATAFEQLVDVKLSSVNGVDQAAIDKLVEERVAKQSAEVRAEAIAAHLDAIVDGDWEQEVKTEAFGKWIESQPDEIKALGESPRLRDAARMMRLYKRSQEAKPEPKPEPKPSTRQKRFEAAVAPRGTGGHAPGTTDIDEFEAGYSG